MAREEQPKKGFTVVELLVVIAVIGILVSIVLVSWSGYQKRTRDNERKSTLTQLATAISAYALQKNNYMVAGSGCGFFGEGNGWVGVGPPNGGGFYPKSITVCLREAGVIANENDFIDPSGCISDTGGACGQYQVSPAKAYMKATCTKNSKPVTYFLAHLETQPLINAEVDAVCDPGSLPWFSTDSQKWGTNYGMNYYVQVK